MNKLRFAILGLAILVAAASSVRAQSQYIGYVYPAGGQQGTTFSIRLGGQGLLYVSDLVVSGEGVSVRLVDYFRVLGNQVILLNSFHMPFRRSNIWAVRRLLEPILEKTNTSCIATPPPSPHYTRDDLYLENGEGI